MRTHGWPYPFRERPWIDIQSFLGGMAAKYPTMEHMRAIVDSVIDTDAEHALAATTSMHDLIVVPRPVPDPPYDVIVVRAPSSLRAPRDGHVLIEHLSCTGHNDRIERPSSEAVPLFWRFIIEKYGIQPGIKA